MHLADLCERENILQVAQTFKTLHACGRNTGADFDPMEMAKTYKNVILCNNGTLFEGYGTIKSYVDDLNDIYFSRYKKYLAITMFSARIGS